MNQHHFLTTYTWDAHNVNVSRMTSSLINTGRCSNREFFLERLNNYQGRKKLTQRRLRGPTTLKDMLKNALRDIANWRTKRQSSYTKFQVFAWMIINSKKKRSLNQLETYQKYAHKFCTWHEPEDQTFCGRSTNLQEQSPGGHKRVTVVRQY